MIVRIQSWDVNKNLGFYTVDGVRYSVGGFGVGAHPGSDLTGLLFSIKEDSFGVKILGLVESMEVVRIYSIDGKKRFPKWYIKYKDTNYFIYKDALVTLGRVIDYPGEEPFIAHVQSDHEEWVQPRA